MSLKLSSCQSRARIVLLLILAPSSVLILRGYQLPFHSPLVIEKKAEKESKLLVDLDRVA